MSSDEPPAGIKPARDCEAASFKIKYYKPYRVGVWMIK